jgi:hypothetical protein
MPYFYEHSNGSIIEKPTIVVKSVGPWEYFSGPFVRSWWFENDLLRPCRTAAPPEPIDISEPLTMADYGLCSHDFL